MNLLTVIPFRINDAPQAERLCDFIFHQNCREQLPAALLVCDPGVHGEMREKIKISAKIAFEKSVLIEAPATTAQTRSEVIKQRFDFTARYVSQHYQWPWVWMEPDVVPLRKGWMKELAGAYEKQPYLAFATHLNINHQGKVETIPTIVGIYSPRITSLPTSISAVGRAIAIQHLVFEADTDMGKIRSDAVILHPDKGGHLIQKLLNQLENTPPPKKRGRPPKVKDHEQTI